MKYDFNALAMPGIDRIAPYVPGKPLHEVAQAFGLTDIIKLASNESPIGCSPLVLPALQEQLKSLHLYPDGDSAALKYALAHHLKVQVDQVSIGNGSNDLLDLAARVFAGPGREVIYAQYAFAVYALATQTVGAKGVEVAARHWAHDLAAMADAVTAQTRLVYLANPNNPTGTWFDEKALRAFLKALPSHVVVVLDEAYYEYVEHADYPDSMALLAEFPQLVVTRTFSKAYGLAGLRVGYAVSHPEVAALMNRVRQPFNVNSLAQAGALLALQDQAHVARARAINKAGMQQLVTALQSMELPYIPSLANFISVEVGDGDAVFQAMMREGVIVRPLRSYAMDNFIRVTVSNEQDNERFIRLLNKVLNRGN